MAVSVVTYLREWWKDLSKNRAHMSFKHRLLLSVSRACGTEYTLAQPERFRRSGKGIASDEPSIRGNFWRLVNPSHWASVVTGGIKQAICSAIDIIERRIREQSDNLQRIDSHWLAVLAKVFFTNVFPIPVLGLGELGANALTKIVGEVIDWLAHHTIGHCIEESESAVSPIAASLDTRPQSARSVTAAATTSHAMRLPSGEHKQATTLDVGSQTARSASASPQGMQPATPRSTRFSSGEHKHATTLDVKPQMARSTSATPRIMQPTTPHSIKSTSGEKQHEVGVNFHPLNQDNLIVPPGIIMVADTKEPVGSPPAVAATGTAGFNKLNITSYLNAPTAIHFASARHAASASSRVQGRNHSALAANRKTWGPGTAVAVVQWNQAVVASSLPSQVVTHGSPTSTGVEAGNGQRTPSPANRYGI